MSQSFDPEVRRASERESSRATTPAWSPRRRGYDFEQCLLDYRRSVLFASSPR